MQRIPLFPESGFTAEQQLVYDKIASGPRGMVVGPMRAALHSPEMADRWQALGEFLRYRSGLAPRLSELAILVCGRYWNSDVEWFVHAGVGLQVGLSAEVIDAIRCAQAPAFEKADEAAVYEYSRQLVEHGRVDDQAYSVIRDTMGAVIVVELTALVGYYTMVAMTLNAHEVPLPQSTPAELQALGSSAQLNSGRTTPLPPAAPAIGAAGQP